MLEPTKTWIEALKNAVNRLQNDYSNNRGMLLTEGDLECHLFNYLMNEKEFCGYHYSKNDNFSNSGKGSELKTSFIHSQVTWFKPDKKSGFEVDLTISDPQNLEVVNIELFEEWTSKGFAYDGPCIAIEVKFIRDFNKAKIYGQEDYLKFINDLIPAKLENIKEERYLKSNAQNIAFVCIVGCKDKKIFDEAKRYLGKHIANPFRRSPENLIPCIFYQDEIIWDKEVLIEEYKSHKEQ